MVVRFAWLFGVACAALVAAGPSLALDPAKSDIVMVDKPYTRAEVDASSNAVYEVSCPFGYDASFQNVSFEYPAGFTGVDFDGRQDVAGELTEDASGATFTLIRPLRGRWQKMIQHVVCVRAFATIPPATLIEVEATAFPGETLIDEIAQCFEGDSVLGGSVAFPDLNGGVLVESGNIGPFDSFGLPPIIGPPSLWQATGSCGEAGCRMRVRALCAALTLVDIASAQTTASSGGDGGGGDGGGGGGDGGGASAKVSRPQAKAGVAAGQASSIDVSCPAGSVSTAGAFVTPDPIHARLVDLVPLFNGAPLEARPQGTYDAPNGWRATAVNVGSEELPIGVTAICLAGSGEPAPANYQGLWWADPPGSEAGWGINYAHQGDIIFATWFTYDAQGKPTWYAAELRKAVEGVYTGSVISVTGVPFSAVPWDASKIDETIVGSMSIVFTDASHATMTYTVNGISQGKSITPQVFAAPVPTCVFGVQSNRTLDNGYQDLWWASPSSSESGWGVNFTQQGDLIFLTWFTYDAAGKPTWFIATAEKQSDTVYAGPISTVVGNPFNAVPWDASKQQETIVGSTTITFTDGNHATFAYTVGGVSQQKQITRQVFVEPGTFCR